MIRPLAAFALSLTTLLHVVPAPAATLPAGQPLTAEMARELVTAALPESQPGERWHVRLATAGFPLPNRARTDGWMEIEAVEVEPRSGRLDASLRVTLAGGEAGVIALKGQAEAQVEVPVPTRPVPRGQLIDEADLTSIWLPAARLDKDALVDVADLVGLEASRRLAAGRVVRTADLRAPRLVRKDEAVTMLYRRGSLDLVTTGVALEPGGAGDNIRIVNPSSKRPLRGIVVGPRQVQVGAMPEGRS
jgi:flagella basal body P-ring formation protein FlgA